MKKRKNTPQGAQTPSTTPQGQAGQGKGMEKGDLEGLLPMADNPRQPWDEGRAQEFRRSLMEFGDLSGIVVNRTSGEIVGGHKRVEAFKEGRSVVIEKMPCEKDAQGTVSYGHVLVDGSRFAYREVEWSERKQKAANIAANKWSAEWDFPKLSSLLKELGDEFLTITGFQPLEAKLFMEGDWTPGSDQRPIPTPDENGHLVRFTKEEWLSIVGAMALKGFSKTTEGKVLSEIVHEWFAFYETKRRSSVEQSKTPALEKEKVSEAGVAEVPADHVSQ